MEPLIGAGSILRIGGAWLVASLPGLALVDRLGFARSVPAGFRFALAAALALAIELLLAMILSLAGSSLVTLLIAVVALAVVSLPFAVRAVRRLGHPSLLAISAAVIFVAGIASTRPISPVSDAIDHIATVGEIVETDVLEPNDVFYAGGDGVVPDVRKGFYHAWLALLAKLSGLPAAGVWYALRPFGLALALLSFAGLIDSTGRSRAHRVLAILAFPFIIHGNSAWFLDTILYPHNFAWLLIWPALALMAEEIESPDRGRRAALGLLAAAMAPLHIFAPVLCVAAALTAPAALFVFRYRPRARRAAGLLILIMLLAAPTLVIRFLQTYHPVNPLHTEASETLYLTSWLSLHAPAPTLERFSLPALLLAVGSVVVLWRRREASWRRALLCGLAWGPLCVSVNPLAGRVLQPTIGYLFVRFLGIVPYPIVAGVVIRDAWVHGRPRSLRRWVPIALVAAAIGSRAPALVDLASEERLARDRAESPEMWRDGFELIDRSIAGRATVLTDPLTGYALPAYTRQRVVAVLDQHSSPSDSTIRERLEDVARALSPYRPIGEAISAMKRWGASHVLLNEAIPRPFATFHDVRLPGEYPRIRHRFGADAAVFRLLGTAGGLRLYQLVGGADRPATARGEPFPSEVGADSVDAAGARPLNESFELLGIEIEPARCHLGDTLSVAVTLRKVSGVPPATPYKMLLRGRLVFTGERERWSRFDRLYARLRGAGSPIEFAEHRLPLDGRYPLSIWDVGETIVDRFGWVVPHNIEPGRYRIGIRLHELALRRNIAIGDWLRPSGGIGMPVGEITVED
jgi:hypothetical protein